MKNLKTLITILCIFKLVGLLSITVTTFAYGIGYTVPIYLWLYFIFFTATILIFCKVTLGYFVALASALAYSFLLNNDIGHYLIFEPQNWALFGVLFVPFLIGVALILHIPIYLTQKVKNKRIYRITSGLLALGFLIYPIADRYNEDYIDHLFIDAQISSNGQVTLNCKPGFADARIFVANTNGKEIVRQIKQYGEYYQGSYFLNDAVIKKNYRFQKLKSITLIKIGKNEVTPQLTWNTQDLKGEVDFLQP